MDKSHLAPNTSSKEIVYGNKDSPFGLEICILEVFCRKRNLYRLGTAMHHHINKTWIIKVKRGWVVGCLKEKVDKPC